MKMKDRVSIIIPVYNCSKFLNKCMESMSATMIFFTELGKENLKT